MLFYAMLKIKKEQKAQKTIYIKNESERQNGSNLYSTDSQTAIDITPTA